MPVKTPNAILYGNPPSSAYQPARDDLQAWMEQVEDAQALFEQELAGQKPVEQEPPSNLILAAFFTTQDDSTVTLNISRDGDSWTELNVSGISVAEAVELSQRDVSITYFQDEFLIFGTGNSAGNHDFVVFRSPDLLIWSKHQVAFDGGAILSDTEPFDGGSVPASVLWAPEPLVSNGKLFLYVSIPYFDNEPRAYGGVGIGFRPFVSELTDLENLVFSRPVHVDTGDNSVGLIDFQVIELDGTFWSSAKRESTRSIMILSGQNAKGPFVFSQEVSDPARSFEGNWLVPVYQSAGVNSSEVVRKVLLCVDANRTNTGAPFAGPGEPDADALVGEQFYFETTGDNPGTPFGPRKKPNHQGPRRHGSGINLRHFPAAATQKVVRAASLARSRRKAFTRLIQLTAGTHYIHPKEGAMYFVSGTDVVNVHFLYGGADHFFLGKFARNDTSGMNIAETAYFAGPAKFGFSQHHDTWAEVRRRGETGQFYLGGQSNGGAASVGEQARLLLRGIAADGTTTTNDGDPTAEWEFFVSQAGAFKRRVPGQHSDNEGVLVGNERDWHNVTITNGSYVWQRDHGESVLLSGVLDGATTLDFSALDQGLTLEFYLNDPGEQVISWVSPSGTLKFPQGFPPNDAGRQVHVAVEKVSSSRIRGIWAQEAGA